MTRRAPTQFPVFKGLIRRQTVCAKQAGDFPLFNCPTHNCSDENCYQTKRKHLKQEEKKTLGTPTLAETKGINLCSNKFTWCFHKQNYYIFNRHANIQRTYYLFIISMTKLDTSQCQHHILSPKPSPARLSTKIWCFCSYFHLVLLLKQNLLLLFVFHLVPQGQFQFTFVFKIPFRHFLCFGKIINCTAVQLMK